MTRALILVDIQNDFCPGGALAVQDGDAVVSVANRLMPQFDCVIATQDWHPPHHQSFASQHGKVPGELIDLHGLPQVLWPDHCVQDSLGAAFHPGLDTERIQRVFRKGLDPRVDSYSGFFDNGGHNPSGLEDYLRAIAVREVHVVGLATDYCVKFTALDARRLGFETRVIAEACRGVNLSPGDVERALAELKEAGVGVL